MRHSTWGRFITLTFTCSAICVLGFGSTASAVAKIERTTGPVAGNVDHLGSDGYCPPDEFFPQLIEPHDRYVGTVASSGGPVSLVVDVCVSSDGGAMGGNTFAGSFVLGAGPNALKGFAKGAQTNFPDEYFSMTLRTGHAKAKNGGPHVVFQGCWGFGSGLIDAAVSLDDPPNTACGLLQRN